MSYESKTLKKLSLNNEYFQFSDGLRPDFASMVDKPVVKLVISYYAATYRLRKCGVCFIVLELNNLTPFFPIETSDLKKKE
jgi:hypothetical protein